MQRYSAGDQYMLSFNPNTPVKVFSKSAGSNPTVWGVDIQGRRGYVPLSMIREERVIIATSALTEQPTELAEEVSKEAEKPVEEEKVTATIVERKPKPKDVEPEQGTSQPEDKVRTPIDTNISAEQPSQTVSTEERTEEESTETLSESVAAPVVESKPDIGLEKSDEANLVEYNKIEELNPVNQQETEEEKQEEANSVKREEADTHSTEDDEENDDYDENEEYKGRVPVKEPPFIKKYAYVTGDNKQKSKDDEFPDLEIIGLNNEEHFTVEDKLIAENKTESDQKNVESDLAQAVTTTTGSPNDELVEPIHVVDDVTTPTPTVEQPTEEKKAQEIEKANQQQTSELPVAEVSKESKENTILTATDEQKFKLEESKRQPKVEEAVTQLNIEKSTENSNDSSNTTENIAITNSTIDNVKSNSLQSDEVVSSVKADPIFVSTQNVSEVDGSNATTFETNKNETVSEQKGNDDNSIESHVLSSTVKPEDSSYLSHSFLPKGVSAEVVNEAVTLATNKEVEDFINQKFEPAQPSSPVPEATVTHSAEEKTEKAENVEKVEVQNIQPPVQEVEKVDVSTESISKEPEILNSTQKPQIAESIQTPAESTETPLKEVLFQSTQKPQIPIQSPQVAESIETPLNEVPVQQQSELPIVDKIPVYSKISPVTESPTVDVITEDIWTHPPTESTPVQEAEEVSEPWYNGLLAFASKTFYITYSELEDLINRSGSSSSEPQEGEILRNAQYNEAG